ncbi:hypothetical protein NH288_02105 [Anaerococcus sp. NML200537]|nr:hypothetical protein [Anaerococcus sp. NML200537]MCW6700883.1 hypothetical protein [Anaerococcus sp. NML200537]
MLTWHMRAMVLLIKGYVSTSALSKYDHHPITKEVFKENISFPFIDL